MREPLVRPRLLPATIAAMAVLLLVKSVSLVRTALGDTMPADAGNLAGAAAAQPGSGSAPAPAPPHAAGVESAAAPPAAPVSDAERALLLDLRKRREALEARARALDERAAEMQAADAKLDDRVKQLAALQARLESLEAARQLHRSENWAGLVKTYESMKPREAAAIFDALDMQVLLQVLDRMQDRKAAAVLAAMQPDRARLATQMLAELRNRATAPPEDGLPPPAKPPAPTDPASRG